MKRSFVFAPAVILAIFLLSSFVPKEKQAVLKSTDGGQTWQDVNTELPKIEKSENVVEADGVMIATGSKGIMRSTEKGKNWQWVISEGGVGIVVERITGGFAAITYNTTTKTRRIRVSLDQGKTWQAIDGGLRPSSSVSSIKQMGKYLICAHPDGIFRSADMGKTWVKVHPGIDNDNTIFIPTLITPVNEPKSVFTLYVSGNMLYAVAGSAGC